MLYTVPTRELNRSLLICLPLYLKSAAVSLRASGGRHRVKEGLHTPLGINHQAGVLPAAAGQHTSVAFAADIHSGILMHVHSIVESVCGHLHAQTKSITCSVDAYSACSGC